MKISSVVSNILILLFFGLSFSLYSTSVSDPQDKRFPDTESPTVKQESSSKKSRDKLNKALHQLKHKYESSIRDTSKVPARIASKSAEPTNLLWKIGNELLLTGLLIVILFGLWWLQCGDVLSFLLWVVLLGVAVILLSLPFLALGSLVNRKNKE